MNIRGARLKATAAASDLHRKLNLRSEIREGLRPIDVYKAIIDLDVPLLFRPLEGVLGVYLSSPEKGILISSSDALNPARQRYTAAHELGHLCMGHGNSVDDAQNINNQESLQRAETAPTDVPIFEAEAEMFASEFLMPKALIVSTCKKMGLNKAGIMDPKNVYQLALRLGTSYQATCYALRSNELVSFQALNRLTQFTPKQIKQECIDEGTSIEHPHSDVILLDKTDHGRQLLLKPGDHVIMSLPEHTSGGFQWTVPDISPLVHWLDDKRSGASPEGVFGSPVLRHLTFTGESKVDLLLTECRSWGNREYINQFGINVDFRGREEGLPRVAREAL